jgi:type IV pilus assembly protein PilA
MGLRREDEDGFTLIELMVVVMIIAILIAIAVPTFLSARQKAQNRQAESNLRNAYSNARTLYTDSQDWGTVTVAGLAAAEPSLTFQAAASTKAREVSVTSTTAAGIILANKSNSGNCYYLRETAAGGAQYGSTTSGACDSSSVGGVTFNADPATAGW